MRCFPLAVFIGREVEGVGVFQGILQELDLRLLFPAAPRRGWNFFSTLTPSRAHLSFFFDAGICSAFSGRSRMCPTDASTRKPSPRHFSMVRAFAGDSTMTRERPWFLGRACRWSGAACWNRGEMRPYPAGDWQGPFEPAMPRGTLLAGCWQMPAALTVLNNGVARG